MHSDPANPANHPIDSPPLYPSSPTSPSTQHPTAQDYLPTHEDLANLLRSPSLPSSPAPPAYSSLPLPLNHRDVDFYCAPVLNGRIGDIELECTDGRKFLVHKKVLEVETVFFHIYYGFVPVWRLNGNPANGPPHPAIPASIPNHDRNPTYTPIQPLNNLLCLPKLLASHIRTNLSSLTTGTQPPGPPVPPKDSASTTTSNIPVHPVTAPTPTSTPYTWLVPETSTVLQAFLSLIYPRGTFTTHPEAGLTDLEITGRVIRASLGYQSTKALNLSRARLMSFIETEPVKTYAMACFFKFGDLARLASMAAVRVERDNWSEESVALMGKAGLAKLEALQVTRITGLRRTLRGEVEVDDHSSSCVRRGMMEEIWQRKVRSVDAKLKPGNELLELLEIDLRGGHCGDCLLNLGKTIQRCLHQARELPRSV